MELLQLSKLEESFNRLANKLDFFVRYEIDKDTILFKLSKDRIFWTEEFIYYEGINMPFLTAQIEYYLKHGEMA